MTKSQLFFRGIILGLVIPALTQLSGCATPPPRQPAPVERPPEKPPEPTVIPPTRPPEKAPPRPATPSASAAWQPLLAKAEQAAARGDYDQALALLERAQRIQPDSAAVYLGMARTHQARGDAAQARATAERGLLYCSSVAECDALRAYTR